MKKQTLIYLLTIVFVGIQFSNCSSGRRTVSFDSLRPADINVSPDIKSLVILDRTKFAKNVLNVVEGILTGESLEEDKAAVQSLTNALQAQLNSSTRFNTKTALERWEGNSITQAFPEHLAWEKVASLCEKYQADALVAIEIFDTDFILTDGKTKSKKKVKTNGVEKEVEVEEYYAEGVSNIKMGLRFYDPKNKLIVDQQLLTETGTWRAQANTKAEALAALISKQNATQNLSRQLGTNYAYRISPMYIKITRSFRGKSKKSPEMEQGARYADARKLGRSNQDLGKWVEPHKDKRSGIPVA